MQSAGAAVAVGRKQQVNKTEHPEKEKKPWLTYILTFADDFAIAGVIIILVLVFDVQLPAWAWVVSGISFVTVMIILHNLMFKALSRKAHMGKESMVGKEATVTEECCPHGMVIMEGEYWRAMSAEGYIEEGSYVEITAVRGLKVEVRRKDA